jgi:uncharacterized protein
MTQQPVGSHRVFPVDFPAVSLGDLALRALKGQVEVTRTPQGLYFQTTLQTQVIVDCSRCLTETEIALETKFEELFAFSKRKGPKAEFRLPDDGVVDLGPIAREYLLLEVPINPLCKEDCKGLCLTCGTNHNEKTCDCDNSTIDPRLDILKSLLPDE